MASLRDMVSEYQDDLRNDIAWLVLWRACTAMLFMFGK